MDCIHSWLGANNWSVIVLNFGLHDIYPSSNASVPLAAYRHNLRQIVTAAIAIEALCRLCCMVEATLGYDNP